MSKLLLLLLIALSFSCARRSFIRKPASYHKKYDAFIPGTTIKLRSQVQGAHKEETIHQDDKCAIHKYCTFEINNDPLRKLTMRGTYTVDSINDDEDKLVLITSDQAKIQLDCGLKYTLENISVANDKYCQNLMREYTIYTFPEFMQTILDMEISYAEPSVN